MQETSETQVRSLGLEDPLEEGMAPHSSIPAWRIPWMEETDGLQSKGSQSQTWLNNLASTHACIHSKGGIQTLSEVRAVQSTSSQGVQRSDWSESSVWVTEDTAHTSTWHMITYMFPRDSLKSSCLLSPLHCVQRSVLYVCISTAAQQYHLFIFLYICIYIQYLFFSDLLH